MKALIAMAVLGTCAASLAEVEAGEPGVARISDRVQQTTLLEPSSVPPPEPAPQAAEKLEPIPEGSYVAYDGYYGESRQRKFHSPVFVWLSCDPNACTLPPDYGFVPPTPSPIIERQRVEYQRYWPNQWYGTPGMQYSQVQYPMVHMPTDTTQLGYTYMYVPVWQPNPGMLPPPPNPLEWQRRVCPNAPGVQQFNGRVIEGHGDSDNEPTPAEGVIVEEVVN